MSSPALIEMRNIRLRRGDAEVFSGLNLRIEAGVNTAILGPNGAGKSSLIKLLLRELYPLADDDAAIHILGDANRDVWSLRRHFGLVSHELQHSFFADATALQVVVSGYTSSIGTWQHQQYAADQIEHARSLLAELALSELAEAPFGRLSTGQQRRLLLARALVHDPHYLLFDEPTSGLDPAATFFYLARLRALIREGRQVLLITHHLHEIPPEIDQVVFLRAGQVTASGNKGDLFTAEQLTELYGTPLDVVERGGFYQVFPAG